MFSLLLKDLNFLLSLHILCALIDIELNNYEFSLFQYDKKYDETVTETEDR